MIAGWWVEGEGRKRRCNQVYDEPRKLRLQMFVWLKRVFQSGRCHLVCEFSACLSGYNQ